MKFIKLNIYRFGRLPSAIFEVKS